MSGFGDAHGGRGEPEGQGALPIGEDGADRSDRARKTNRKRGGENPHYHGHRARLRQRFMEGGADALPDYELLELVLFRAIPRRDTKPLAKALLEKFGSFAAVVNASPARLREVSGMGEAVIVELKVVRAASLRLLNREIMNRPILSSWTQVTSYCQAAMGYSEVEQFRILFLDKRNRLIADEVQQEGTVDHTPVYVREIMKRALELSATALILVHNHPSGDPTPSQADVTMTREIVDTADKLGIVVHDHIIVGREGNGSLRAAGLM